MQVDKHDLVHDFPEHKDAIHELKMNNAHFAKLHTEYHEVTHEIHKIETNDSNVADDYLHDLKTKRSQLKDEIYQIILKVE